MFVLKNRHAPALSGANCHVKLMQSFETVAEKYPVILAQIWY